jgi:hypothetical protein
MKTTTTEGPKPFGVSATHIWMVVPAEQIYRDGLPILRASWELAKLAAQSHGVRIVGGMQHDERFKTAEYLLHWRITNV